MMDRIPLQKQDTLDLAPNGFHRLFHFLGSQIVYCLPTESPDLVELSDSRRDVTFTVTQLSDQLFTRCPTKKKLGLTAPFPILAFPFIDMQWILFHETPPDPDAWPCGASRILAKNTFVLPYLNLGKCHTALRGRRLLLSLLF